MRVTKNVTKKGTSFYIIRSISGGSTEIVEKLGTEKEIKDIDERYWQFAVPVEEDK